ncbi:glycolate oxidase subunit GlcF [Ottowia thiooxydans]|uniref:glycolate oxidase subunit GlcF n=1 Tax=Ottowia thiooxydans TaxID=219182 RepID=UPI000417457F|nr:glycolate oxidase subunit GlcF [Ottowia thiooxydans]
MKTNFSEAQLADPQIAEADTILKSCQHFGFCTSGCPTYVLLHDENDSPRGRIDLIKDMLESGGAPSEKTVGHIDRCLSCMSCMTTCAVKVDYMHLADTARQYIETHYRRPWAERWTRDILSYVLPRRPWFRAALGAGRLASRASFLVPTRFKPALDLLPKTPPASEDELVGEVFPAEGSRRWRVALLSGCVQPEMAPQINAATIRLLTRFGCEVVVPKEAGCCGSLNLHMGKTAAARSFARVNVNAWARLLDEGLDAIVTNASGCGTTVKDYAHLLSDDPEIAESAAKIAALARDVSEWILHMRLPLPQHPRRYRVAYHDACSLKNVQHVTAEPRKLLKEAGFVVKDVPESHFCCGSAGTYNILQPVIAAQLGQRKAANIAGTEPQIVAAGNIGCITQIGLYSQTPITHTVELLDWAHGGPVPLALRGISLPEVQASEMAAEKVLVSEHVVSFVPPPDKPQAKGPPDVGIW